MEANVTTIKRAARPLGLALALSMAVGCAGNPSETNAQDASSQGLPSWFAQEQAQGEQAHPQIVAQFGGAYDDPELQAYVERVGERIKNATELAGAEFTYTVLDTEQVNAFAVPGGYVYVTRGILALFNDEAELAGVLGHEIGHVTARHSTERRNAGGLAALGQVLGTLAGAYFGGEVGAELGRVGGGLLGQAGVQGYSRSQEYESDKLGVRYLARAGYDPFAMADGLRALEAWSALQQELTGRGRGGGVINAFFASHPNTPDRVERAVQRAEERLQDQAAPADERNREVYLAALDGTLFGESPSQGFVRGTRFVHPGLRFAFAYPDGFRLQNRPEAVIGQGDGRLIQFTLGRGGGDPLDHLTNEWGRGQRIDDADGFTTDQGLPAAIASGRVNVDGQALPALLGVVEAGDFYRFLMVGGDLGRGDLSDLRAVLDSFERLSAEEAASYPVRRVRVERLDSGQEPLDLADAMQVEALPAEHLVAINGLSRGFEVPPEGMVKLIREE